VENLKNLKQKTITGFTWSLGGQTIIYVVTLGGTIIMSRLLGPSVFGLFGMLSVFSSLASLFVGFGLSHVIVQNQSLDQRDLSSIFWLNTVLGLMMSVIFFFSANAIAGFYAQPELASITKVFSIIFLIYGCSAVPLGLLSKRLHFKQLVISQLLATTISYAAGITCAYFGRGVWSLVLQSMVNHFVYVCINYYYAQWKPDVTFTKTTLGKIGKFSRNFLPSQLLDFFSLNMDMMLVGKYFGKTDLGYYGRATALVQLPVNSLGNIFNRTFFSALAALQDNKSTFSSSYLRGVKMLTLVVMPILVLTAVLAEKIVLMLFGVEWIGMTPFVTILAIGAAIGSYNSFNDSVMTSQGRTDLLLRINVVEKIILIIGVVVGVRYGIIGVAYAKVFAVASMFIPKLLVLSMVSRISLSQWFSAQLRLFAGLLLCGGVNLMLMNVVDSVLLALILSASGGLLVNGVWLLATREPSLQEALEFVKNIFKRWV
jgi:O-antigen/teichoic acid export membrane protein